MPPTSKYKSAAEILEEVEEGDLIEIRRVQLVVFTHWAVYVGNGYAINVNRPSKQHQHATITKELLITIVGNDKCRVNNLEGRARWKGLSAQTKSEIVRRAESKVGDVIEYRLLSENCEYFATSCRFGEENSFCSQVTNTATGIAVFSGIAVFAFALVGQLNRPNRHAS